VFGIFSYAIDRGYPLELAQTMSMNMLVVLEIFHLFFIRNIHGTSLTWAAVRGTKVVWGRGRRDHSRPVRSHLPPLGADRLWHPIRTPVDGLLIIGVGAAFFAVIEMEKQIRLGLRGTPRGPEVSSLR
jgi:hypothetical protein